MSDQWLADHTHPTWQDVPGEALHDSADFDAEFLYPLFDGRADALRHLADGELGLTGGLREWDGKDAYMGFITTTTLAQIAQLLAMTATKQRMLADATRRREGVVKGLNAVYADMCVFLSRTAAKGYGLALLYVH
ncbi:hypothetical protein [Actinophytocola sp.]|uniref:hypothetical protein n=1 Tax=Actinophytocola sp. TaxID=1872138 RepID=UPI003D6A5B43